jgi:hypothetical protein
MTGKATMTWVYVSRRMKKYATMFSATGLRKSIPAESVPPVMLKLMGNVKIHINTYVWLLVYSNCS